MRITRVGSLLRLLMTAAAVFVASGLAPGSLLPTTAAHGSRSPAASQEQPGPDPTEGPRNIEMSGLVYDESAGPGMPIEDARVVAPSCPDTPHQPFQATTGADGRYELTLPGVYCAPGCTIEVTVTVDGYDDLIVEFPYEDLALDPERDFRLWPSGIIDYGPSYVPIAEKP